jgi:hypothetical protein
LFAILIPIKKTGVGVGFFFRAVTWHEFMMWILGIASSCSVESGLLFGDRQSLPRGARIAL